ncbi:MAG: hypothetical protein GF329_03260 [Candidatus Lokiarchaeota archaeon]|nr:hypothetical protein [Candidatus Lokiarchaeota archaeon]
MLSRKKIIYSMLIGFIPLIIISIIIPNLYLIVYTYMVLCMIYFGIIVRNIKKFGKISLSIIIISLVVYFIKLSLMLPASVEVIINLVSDIGLLIFFIYFIIILPKYSSRLHMGAEDSKMGSYHIHEGLVGIILYIITSFILFIPMIIAFFTPFDEGLSHSICLIIGGAGNIIATFFIARDWDDVINGLFIEKVEEGEQAEEHESFWEPPKPLLRKFIKLNDFTTGLIFCGSAIGLYFSPLYEYDFLKLIITIISLAILTFGGFLIGRDWILMIQDRFGEIINRPLLLALKDSLDPGEKIISVDSITYPIWVCNGIIEKKKRRFLFFKKKIKINKTLLIDDATGKFLYLRDGLLERFDKFIEDFEEIESYLKGYPELQRVLNINQINKKIDFMDEKEIFPGILPIYAIKLKNEKENDIKNVSENKKSEKYLGVHINSGHRIKLFKDYSINYLMPFKEESRRVKNLLYRMKNFFKSLTQKKSQAISSDQ